MRRETPWAWLVVLLVLAGLAAGWWWLASAGHTLSLRGLAGSWVQDLVTDSDGWVTLDPVPPGPLHASAPRVGATSSAEVQALELGRAFRAGEARPMFLARLQHHQPPQDRRFPIAWRTEPDRRWLAVLLAHTPTQIAAMSDAGFAAWQHGFSVRREAEQRRLDPEPDDLTGYGGAEARAPCLRSARDVVEAKDRGDLLARVEDRVRNGWLTLLFVPRGGQGATMYGVSTVELGKLTDPEFQSWRRRFLRWIEIHTPGQSAVRELATLSDEQFEQRYRESKDRHGGLDIGRALDRFAARTGIQLARPRFAAHQTAPVVAAVADRSAASAAGLRPGDRVLAVEGEAVGEWDELIFLVNAWAPGSQVRLSVDTAGVRREVVLARNG